MGGRFRVGGGKVGGRLTDPYHDGLVIAPGPDVDE